tara:strand:+ start:878 stop:2233 length:1356 start_codon:yes stop_codon:yes gene_type:complete
MKFPDKNKCTIAIIGIGYVGLPLAVEFAKDKVNLRNKKRNFHKVLGFDINKKRIQELNKGIDVTKEITKKELKEAKFLEFTHKSSNLVKADVWIISVPTPIDEKKQPNLLPLENASELIGNVIKEKINKYQNKKNHTMPIIIFESTVFPGATEEICIPIIERFSNLKFNIDFVCGYSPERINPGDNIRKLTSIKKVTSGSTPESSKWIDDLYGSIIEAGTHLADSIKVAETAKIIENTQRDINIALMNELAVICNSINVDTLDVLKAASTKWNFLNFEPGLVGGHCIGVDPYYLTWKAKELGYNPEVVLAGRKINDQMSEWLALKLIKAFESNSIAITNSRILILGITFKENCPDLRNSKVIDMVEKLKNHSANCTVVDPLADLSEVTNLIEVEFFNKIEKFKPFDAVIAAVKHKYFQKLKKTDWENLIKENGILFDLKGIIPRSLNPKRI